MRYSCPYIQATRVDIYVDKKKKVDIYSSIYTKYSDGTMCHPRNFRWILDNVFNFFFFFSMFLTLFQINLISAKFPSKFATTHGDDRGLVTFRESTNENFREHSDQTLSRESTDENFQKHSDQTLSSEISGKMPRTISFTRYNVPNLSIIYRWPLFSEVVVGVRDVSL